MKLADYLTDAGLKDEDFATKLGCDRTTVLRLRTAQQRPSHALMEKIIAATDGEVQPNDFFELPPRDEARAA